MNRPISGNDLWNSVSNLTGQISILMASGMMFAIGHPCRSNLNSHNWISTRHWYRVRSRQASAQSARSPTTSNFHRENSNRFCHSAIIPYEILAAGWFASERARLASIGKTLSYPDGQIASIAAANQLVNSIID